VNAVIDLHDWAAIKGAERGNPMPFGWRSLAMPSDARDHLSRGVRLGLVPVLLYGITDDGTCMCRKGKACGKSSGKHPVLRNWQDEDQDPAEIDRALVDDWRWNLGLRMGRQRNGSTYVAIDVDGDLSLLEPIEQQAGKRFPRTLTAKTSRGFHLIYRVPNGAVIRNRQKLSPGVDTRAEGGLIVAPPSRHLSGARYQWIDAREPEVLT